MDSINLLTCLSKNIVTKKYFGSVHCASQLPRLPRKFPKAYVFNTDECELPGTHWVGIFVKSKNHVYYFDSLNQKPVPFIAAYLKKFKRITRNRRSYQSLDSTVCGHYVLFFLFMCCLGDSMVKIENFLLKQPDPDYFVVYFVEKFFNECTETKNYNEFLKNILL